MSTEANSHTSLAQKIDPESVRSKAVKIASQHQSNGSQPSIEQISSIHLYVRNNIEYVSDPANGDYFADPNETLKTGAGDCDCQAILTASMLNSIGASTCIFDIHSNQGTRHAFPVVNIQDLDKEVAWNQITSFYSERDVELNQYISMDFSVLNGPWFPADPILCNYLGDIDQFKQKGYLDYENSDWSNEFRIHYPQFLPR